MVLESYNKASFGTPPPILKGVVEVPDAVYPSEMFPKGVRTTPDNFNEATYKDIIKSVHDLYDNTPDIVQPNNNPRASLAGCLIRLAGHDFMDFRPDEAFKGGADGCLDFNDGDNAGLPSCMTRFGIPEMYGKHKDTVSMADFFVIIAEGITGRTATDFTANDYYKEGTMARRFLDTFKSGRTTVDTCKEVDKRLPNPEHGCTGRGPGKDGLKQIFLDNIYKG